MVSHNSSITTPLANFRICESYISSELCKQAKILLTALDINHVLEAEMLEDNY